MALPSRYGIDKKINSMKGLSAYENGGKGSGNFGHSGRPGEVGGSASEGGATGLARAKEIAEDSKQWQKLLGDIAERTEQIKSDTGGRGTLEGTLAYEKIPKKIIDTLDLTDNPTSSQAQAIAEVLAKEGITGKLEKAKTNPKTGDQEKEDGGKYAKRKDYKAEQKGVDARDGHRIGTEFADLEAQLSTARTNLKMLQKDSGKAYDDLAGRNRYLTRQSEIARAFSQARALGKSKLSTETKKLVKEMETELRSIMADYTDLGIKKYFDPDLNAER